jgi:hypothetical protein
MSSDALPSARLDLALVVGHTCRSSEKATGCSSSKYSVELPVEELGSPSAGEGITPPAAPPLRLILNREAKERIANGPTDPVREQ